MSWSIDAAIWRPVEVASLLRRTREVLGELLALDEVPELTSNAPPVTIETLGTNISFTVLLPSGDGAEVDTISPDLFWAPEPGETMLVTVTSRYRFGVTCVSLVLCIATALAAAELGDGEYLDEERMFVRPETNDPHEAIASTRLAPSDLGFAERCERYVRQFPHLQHWPKTTTLAG